VGSGAWKKRAKTTGARVRFQCHPGGAGFGVL